MQNRQENASVCRQEGVRHEEEEGQANKHQDWWSHQIRRKERALDRCIRYMSSSREANRYMLGMVEASASL